LRVIKYFVIILRKRRSYYWSWYVAWNDKRL